MLAVRKCLEIRYDRPVSNARRVLRVRPLSGHAGWRGGKYFEQQAHGFKWRCEPSSQEQQVLGALVLEARAPHLAWRFEMQATVQVLPAPAPRAKERPDLGRWLLPSLLCERTPELVDLARSVGGSGIELAAEMNQLAHRSLRYEEGATDEATTASAALGLGAGVCQDFAHLLIALCRARGAPARYVSGYGRAPGRMHAWAEVWVESGWHAFDPTRGEALDEAAVAVAVGRDFRDVRPLEGAFEARGRARSRTRVWCCVDETTSGYNGLNAA